MAVEVNRSYVDIASKVNSRIIGEFPTKVPAINGESWFLNGQRQQGLRQVYTFKSTTAISHGINIANIYGFVRCWGEFTDGTNWYGLIHGSNTAIAGQISFYITATQIIFMVGAGAPSINNGSGTIVLEWLSEI